MDSQVSILRIFNTLSGNKEIFTPQHPTQVHLYVCGVTVYDFCHLGHARTYVMFDVIYRHLKSCGYQVNYVKNFTDVDDKIIKRAKQEGISPEQVAHKYIQAYNQDMDALGILRPTQTPLVTQSINDIIDLIERLIQKGMAYQVDGDVYFSVRLFPDYLCLSKRQLDENEPGARVEKDDKKQDPFDFALWKKAKPGEPSWPSPFGFGRPGWHIECSAMLLKCVGTTVDIHGGGRDLIFPHHDNEIAQSQAATGQPLAKYWMHTGMLNIDNEKMSKSLGNFFTIREVLRYVHPESLRAYFLTASYRNPLNFDITYQCPQCKQTLSTQELEQPTHLCGFAINAESRRNTVIFPNLEDAEKRLNYVYKTLLKVQQLLAAHPNLNEEGPYLKADLIDGLWPQFNQAMNDDFNTSAALATLSPVLSFMNDLIQKPQKPIDTYLRTLKRAAQTITQAGQVLGIYQQDPIIFYQYRQNKLKQKYHIDQAFVEHTLELRKQARAEKRFADADTLRQTLLSKQVMIKDTPTGTEWEIIED